MESVGRILQRLQRTHGLQPAQARLSWAMDWLLFGIASVTELQAQLALKGGVVLMKCFQGPRFSSDIDANLLSHARLPGEEAIRFKALVDQACSIASRAGPIRFFCTKSEPRPPAGHPEGWNALLVVVHYAYPTDHFYQDVVQSSSTIDIEVSLAEGVRDLVTMQLKIPGREQAPVEVQT